MNIISEYNKEPVLFCKHCLSLNILDIVGKTSEDTIELYGSEYCRDCSSASVGLTSIEHWKELYKYRYHKPYINYGKSKRR